MGTPLLTRELSGLSEVLQQPGHFLSMGRRHVFQIEKLHVIRGRIHLPGEKMGIGRNLDARFDQPLPHLGIIRHHGEHARIRLSLVASAGAAIQRGFKRLFSEVLPCAQNRNIAC